MATSPWPMGIPLYSFQTAMMHSLGGHLGIHLSSYELWDRSQPLSMGVTMLAGGPLEKSPSKVL